MDKDWDKIRERVIEAYNVLVETGKVEDLKELAVRCKYREISLKEIWEGKRQVPVYLIKNFTAAYGVNPGFIYTGKGHRFIDKSNIIKTGTKVSFLGDPEKAKALRKGAKKTRKKPVKKITKKTQIEK